MQKNVKIKIKNPGSAKFDLSRIKCNEPEQLQVVASTYKDRMLKRKMKTKINSTYQKQQQHALSAKNERKAINVKPLAYKQSR